MYVKDTYEVDGTCGKSLNPCVVLVAEMSDGSAWYAVEDSMYAYRTFDPVKEGVCVEELSEEDSFFWGEPIEDLEALEEAVES